MSDELLSEVRDGIGYVTLNRPEARNAVYPVLLDEAITAIAAHEADAAVRVIVFGGNGGAFCAGADVERFLVTLPAKTAQQIQDEIYARFMGLARALKLSAKPTLAAVDGPAVGAGCEFAVNCDFRIASDTALFWENWIDFGIMPPLGGTFLLPRLIGSGRAADMVMRSRRVKADEALAWGLVSEVAPVEQFADAVHQFALGLAKRPPLALATIKTALRRGADGTLASEWEYNLQAQSVLLTSAEFHHALEAIMAARTV